MEQGLGEMFDLDDDAVPKQVVPIDMTDPKSIAMGLTNMAAMMDIPPDIIIAAATEVIAVGTVMKGFRMTDTERTEMVAKTIAKVAIDLIPMVDSHNEMAQDAKNRLADKENERRKKMN
jgi:hypothetical protein